MPESQSARVSRRQSDERAASASRKGLEARGASRIHAGISGMLGDLVGSGVGEGDFLRHVSLLGDPRMSEPANTSQRARIITQLQRTYGNRYVQRVAEYISRQGVDQKVAQRNGDPKAAGGNLGDLEFAELKKKLAAMSAADIGKLRQDKAFLDKIQSKYTNQQFGEIAATLMLNAPDTVVQKAESLKEATRLLTAQLQDKNVARTLIDKKVEVVIIPRNVPMTDLPQFKSLKDAKTFDGRDWTPVRGSGGMKVGDKIYVAIAEENLMGTDVDKAKVPGAGNYCKGYSTTTHEFAHTIHNYGLPDEDRKKITAAYKAKKAQEDSGKAVEWVDGPSKHKSTGKKVACYASMNELEYFAQIANAWLGTNAGTDPYTGQPRHNGKDWVLKNEPKDVTDILKRTLASEEIKNANPRKS